MARTSGVRPIQRSHRADHSCCPLAGCHFHILQVFSNSALPQRICNSSLYWMHEYIGPIFGANNNRVCLSCAKSLRYLSDRIVAELQVPQRRSEGVDLFAGVIQRERGAHRALHSEAPENWLCVVVPCPYGDALTIERCTDIF